MGHYVFVHVAVVSRTARYRLMLYIYCFLSLPELNLDQHLSDEFCRNHFLVGLLLQEVKQALNVIKDVRKVAIATLRNVLAKHCFDGRYQGKVRQQSRVVCDSAVR